MSILRNYGPPALIGAALGGVYLWFTYPSWIFLGALGL